MGAQPEYLNYGDEYNFRLDPYFKEPDPIWKQIDYEAVQNLIWGIEDPALPGFVAGEGDVDVKLDRRKKFKRVSLSGYTHSGGEAYLTGITVSAPSIIIKFFSKSERQGYRVNGSQSRIPLSFFAERPSAN